MFVAIAAMSAALSLGPLSAAAAIDNPRPADGETAIILNLPLAWDAVPGAHGYDVYFGETGAGPLDKIADSVSSAFLPLPPVEADRDYSWQVVAHMESGDLAGPVWGFQTTDRFFADGYGLTGSWQDVSQTCTGSGPTLRCRLRGALVVSNNGLLPPPARSVTRVYLSGDVALDAGDQLLAGRATPGAKLITQTIVINKLLKRGQSASGRHLIAVVDVTNRVGEVDERDNAIVSEAIP
jgi:hypothetical protein